VGTDEAPDLPTQAEAEKKKGNEKFAAGDYAGAERCYTASLVSAGSCCHHRKTDSIASRALEVHDAVPHPIVRNVNLEVNLVCTSPLMSS
jgi:hypothetical protein